MADGDGRQVARALAAAVLAQVPALTDLLVETIQGQNPGYRAVNVVADADLRRSCRDNSPGWSSTWRSADTASRARS